MRRGIIVFLVAIGCSDGKEDSALEIREETRGDTVYVISSGTPELRSMEPIEVFWRDDSLTNPGGLIALGSHLIIADGVRIHAVSRSSGEGNSFGRQGEGPGEFGSVMALGAFGTDTIATYDRVLRRLSLFSIRGQFLESFDLRSEPPIGNPWDTWLPIVRSEEGLVTTRIEAAPPGRAHRVILATYDLDRKDWSLLEEWDDRVWTAVPPGVIVPREPFSRRAIVGLSQDGRLAHGDGVDYCITLGWISGGPSRVTCRERDAVPVGEGVRSPPLEFVAEEREREVVRHMIEAQDLGETLPHFDQLLFSDEGQLWVRVLHEDLANVHPSILDRRPELAPSHRYWEVFDEAGALVQVVEVPGDFQPRLILEDGVYGVLTLESGEVVIGRGTIS